MGLLSSDMYTQIYSDCADDDIECLNMKLSKYMEEGDMSIGDYLEQEFASRYN